MFDEPQVADAQHIRVARQQGRGEAVEFRAAGVGPADEQLVDRVQAVEGADDAFAQQEGARLHALLDGSQPAPSTGNGTARTTLDVFRAVARLRPRYGVRAFGPYIFSMSRSAADALAVLDDVEIGKYHDYADTYK